MRLKHFLSVFLTLLTLSVGQMWGADPTESFSGSSFSTQGTSSSGSSYTITGTNLSITDDKFYGGGDNTYAQSYAGAKMTFTPNTGVTIKKIVITASSTSYTGAQSSGSWSKSAGTSIGVSGTTITWQGSQTSSFNISHSKQLRWTSIVVTYTSSCSNKVTINKGSESHGTFTLDKSGEIATCSGLSVVVTPSASTHYHVSSVTATTPTTGGAPSVTANSPSNGKYTITYASNSTGASTINVSFVEDTKYTLNYHDGNGDGSKNNVYENTNLITALGTPAASCDETSTTFVGWTTTEITTKTDTKPTFVAADAVVNATTAAAKYYAVYAKSNTGSWSITNIDNINGGTGYAAYDGAHTSGINYTSSNVMQNSGIQFKSNSGYIYSTAASSGDITSIIITSSSANWSVYTSSSVISSAPSSGAISISSDGNTRTFTVSATGHKYFRIKGGADTPKASNITVNYGTNKEYITTCCTKLGSINGSISLSNEGCTPTQLKATWKTTATAGISSQILHVYNASNDNEVTTSKITGISPSTSNQTQTINGLTPCTSYYVVVENVSQGGTYCDGGLITDKKSSSVQTVPYNVDFSGCSNVTNNGASTTCAAADYSVTFAGSSARYALPENVTSVTIGGVAKTQGSHFTWNQGTGVLTIPQANITGNIVIDVDGVDQGACESTPVLGTASLSGTFSLTNVGVTCASITPGDYCDVTEYGFIWYEGTGDKVIGGEGVTKVTNNGAYTSGAFVNTLTNSSFTATTTYSFRAYATNSGGLTGYSAAATFTPYTVSYNKNDDDATGSVATQVVNTGGSVTLPNASAFSLDCNDMTKWALNSADSETKLNPGGTYSNITANAEFYAVWTTKTYTVQFAAGSTPANGGAITGSHANATKTCGKNLTLPGVTFYSTGYTQDGWAKADGGNKTNNLNGSYSSNQAQIFYPYWLINTYNVTKGTKTGCSGNDFTLSATSVDHYGSITVTASPDNAHKGSAQVSVSPSGNATVSGTTISNIIGDIEVSVSFAAKETATIILHDATGAHTQDGSHYEADNYTLPSTAATCTESELYGWYTETYVDQATAPSGAKYIAKNASKALAAGANHFYAVYATIEDRYTNNYTKITSVNDLTSGDYLISSGSYCMGNTIQSTNRMAETSVSAVNNVKSNPAASLIWTITKSGTKVTLYNDNASKYLAVSGGVIAVQTDAHNFTFDYGTTKENSWTFTSETSPTYQLSYSKISGNSYNYFVMNTSQTDQIDLYKRDKAPSAGAPYTTSPSCTSHTLSSAIDPSSPVSGTVELGKTTVLVGKTTTATATPSDHYTFSHWTISGTGAGLSHADGEGKSTDNPVTVTMGTADATITAHFTEKPKCTVEFYNNGGSALSSTTYWLGETPSAPTLNDGTTGEGNACDETSDKHYGWTQTAWQQTITKDDVDAKTAANVKVYTKGSTLPAVTAEDDGKTIKYYAVWAHAENSSVQKNYTLSISYSDCPASYDNSLPTKNANEVGGTGTVSVSFGGTGVMNQSSSIQFRKSSKGAGCIYNTNDLGSITGITTNNNNIAYNIGTSENPSSGTSGGYFKIYNNSDNAQNPSGITVNFTKTVGSVTYSAFLTNCCNQLEDINGAVEFTNPTTAVLTWDKLENVAASNAYVVSYRTGEAAYGTTNVGAIDLNGTKATCTITSLSCNTAYDFKIAVTAASGYCDKEQIIEDQNSGKYAITLTGNGTVTGGTFEVDEATSCGGTTITLSADKSAGYDFSSWTVSDGNDITADVLKDGYEATDEIVEITMPAKDITVTAAFSTITYTITYENMTDATNHVSNPSSYNVESDAISLGNPTKEGFNFGGWFVDSDLAVGHEAGSPAIAAGSTGNKTFYAKWIADDKWSVAITAPSHGTITVSWNGGASSFSSGAQNIDKNTDITITATPADGYQLSSLKIGDADFTSGSIHKLIASIVISATFTPITYSITYNNMEGATNHDDNVASYTIEASDDVLLNEPSKTGYTFDGWFTDDEFDPASEIAWIEAGSTGNVVVYAKWTANEYTVTLNKQGGTGGGSATITATFDSDMPTLSAKPGKSGYTFQGYYGETNGDGTQYYNADKTSAHVWDQATNEASIYAYWTPNQTTITLNNEGASTAGTTEVVATYDAAPTAINVPEKTDYVFGGYWTEASGAGSQLIDAEGNWIANVDGYTGAEKVWKLNAATLELHAFWKQSFTMTFAKGAADATGDAPSLDGTSAFTGDLVTLPANTYSRDADYYRFNEWAVEDVNGDPVAVTNGKFTMPASNVTITAQWWEVPELARTFTSNVTMTYVSYGANNETVRINNNNYTACKGGNSNNTGDVAITVPAGATALHFHAVAWKDKTATIDMTGVTNASKTSFELVADAGATNSGTYTLTGDPIGEHYFCFTFNQVNTATTITFTRSSGTDKRFIIYGANAVYPEIKLNPTEFDFNTVRANDTKSQVFEITTLNGVSGTLAASITDDAGSNYSVSSIVDGKVTVTFDPKGAESGTFTAKLRVAASNASVTADLTATAIPATQPEITVDRNAIDFGRIEPNDAAGETIAVELAYIDEDGVTATLSGTDASKFALSATKLTTNGDLVISKNTTAIGIYSANLTLSATGATDVFIPLTIKVTNKWAETYSSNVTISAAEDKNVKVGSSNTTYPAVKASSGGAATIQLPKGTQKLHFHVVAWKNESADVTVSGSCFGSSKVISSIPANSEVSGTKDTYTFTETDVLSYYHELDIENEIGTGGTTVTIQATSGKRFVLFGVNQEGGTYEIEDNTNISTLPENANIEVKDGVTLTVDATSTLDNLIVENGGTVEVAGLNELTVVNNLVIQTTSGSTENDGKSGQLTGSVMPVVSGDLFIEIKLCEGAMDAVASRKWYCISAPFNVNMNGGFFWGDGTPMVLNTDFQLFEWDGDRRATGISGWKRVSGVMKAGIAYFIGFDDERSNQNIIKLKATNKTISNKSKINAPEHGSSVGDKYANWNGLANPNFRHIALNKTVQAFDYNVQAYNTYATGDYNFVVGTPFFIKETGDITIEAADNGAFRAPKREVEQLSYCVRIVREDKAGFDNQMYVRASEEASTSYEEGHDLVTMNAETSNYGALLWTVNYGGKRLAIEEAPLVNDKASYALSLYAPADGAYRIETPTVREDASLYLTYEGNIIWDLSAGAYELDLNKGATEGYGLMLVRKAPQVTTGVETIDNSQFTIHNCQKVILNDHVYILRDAQLYDVTGKAVK